MSLADRFDFKDLSPSDPRRSQDGPRWPKTRQDALKTRQDASKKRQDAPKTRPRRLKDAPKTS